MPRAGLAAALFLLIASCAPPGLDAGPRAFERWLKADPSRAASFVRFDAMLEREGVADVVPSRELWVTDRLAPECAVEAFVAPPEAEWPHIVPTLRYLRDHVIPVVGPLSVASGYRDEEFSACVNGAPQSAHRGFHALDLIPLDTRVTRDRLIATLCPLHEREGARFDIGMGIYQARRFHIDARGYRGWGADYHRATFPCDAETA